MAILNGRTVLFSPTITTLPIEQTFDARSEHAQSGQAVAEAVAENSLFFGRSKSLPIHKAGKYRVTNGVSDMVLSKGNLVNLLGLVDGTYTGNGLTVTIAGNKISLSGTTTAATYFRISGTPSVCVKADVAAAATYDVPYALKISTTYVINSGSSLGLKLRNVSGAADIFTVRSNIQDFSQDATYGQLYFYAGAGVSYDFEMTLGLAFADSTDYIFADAVDPVVYTHSGQYDISDGYVMDAVGNATAEYIINPQTVGRIYAESDGDNLNLYMPCSSESYRVRYLIEHIDRTDRNAYGFRLGGVWLCDADLTDIAKLSTDGEWDMAIMLSGRPDYIGLGMHGSERAPTYTLSIDGKSVTAANISQYCGNVVMSQIFTMFDPNDETTVVGTHNKALSFTANDKKFRIGNCVNWSAAVTAEQAYLAMGCIARTADDNTTIITDRAYSDKDYIVTDIATPPFSPTADNHGVSEYKSGANGYHFDGETYGITIDSKIESCNDVSTLATAVSESAAKNKLYINYAYQGKTAAVGDAWSMQTAFVIDKGGNNI